MHSNSKIIDFNWLLLKKVLQLNKIFAQLTLDNSKLKAFKLELS